VINKTSDPEAGPGPSTQAHKEGQVRNPPHINRHCPLFVRNGRYFITEEDAEKWDQEQYDSGENRLLTLKELEKEERLANEKIKERIIENLSIEKRQVYEIQKEYASEKHFRSIYEEAEGIYKEEEPPHGDIIFLKRERDPVRQHSSLKSITVWEGLFLHVKILHMHLIKSKIVN
jgi:hypothetical protein